MKRSLRAVKVNKKTKNGLLQGIDELQKKAIENIKKQEQELMNNLITEGLKRKGFVFGSTEEMIAFVDSRCDIEQISQCEILYRVDEKPFVYHNQITTTKMVGNDIKVDLGHYNFID